MSETQTDQTDTEIEAEKYKASANEHFKSKFYSTQNKLACYNLKM